MIGFGLAIAEIGAIAGLPADYPRDFCLTCGAPSEFAHEYVLMGGKQVCSGCAEIVANVWSMRHGGQYLTWENEKRERSVGYRKKDIPEELRWRVFERDGFQCKHCGSRQKLRADHVVPESAGGETTIENLQTLCLRCNSRKGKRLPS